MNSRLQPADLLLVGAVGMRTRPLRAGLSTLGIAIGIAAVVAVLGTTRSSQADLLARIDMLGTNLLTVVNGSSLAGDEAELPGTAAGAIARTDGVLASTPTAELTGVGVYRSDRMPAYATGGLAVRAADGSLLSTLDGQVTHGTYLNQATGSYPTTVLGNEAARTLGIADLAGSPRVWLGSGPSSCRGEGTCGSGGRAGHWHAVIGILGPVELAPEVDRSALIGFPVAARDFGYDSHPSRIYVRAQTDRTVEVAGLLARAANPHHPEAVNVSRPSDVLAARLAAADASTALLLGLGTVAILVGGIGIANVMVVAVLERRTEIGLRRALGAARRHVAAQFLVESLLLGTAGGGLGVVTGAAVTYALAFVNGWQPLIPPVAVGAGLATALGLGAIAGLYPALRAARLSPTEALRTT